MQLALKQNQKSTENKIPKFSMPLIKEGMSLPRLLIRENNLISFPKPQPSYQEFKHKEFVEKAGKTLSLNEPKAFKP